jgi:D-alanyl-D-alanine carboxypeptidase/D-alanyl-D-alanine-endopeptidase (penicillin-binding protein 4)
MKRSLLLRFTSVTVFFLFICSSLRADLNSDIRAALQDKALTKGEVSVEILRLDAESAKPQAAVFRHNSDVPLMPASNLKLVTTSAFLDHFGSDFKFRTTLARRGDDLILIGDGDPSFGDAELLKRAGWESSTVFANWADMLKKRGITSVRNVVVDDSIFDENFVHPNWPVKQQHFRYVAGVGGMNFNANSLDFYLRVGASGAAVSYSTDPTTSYASIKNECVTGNENAVWLSRTPNTNLIDLKGQTNASNMVPVSVTIHDPPMYTATVLAETLEAHGIKVTGKPERERGAREKLGKDDILAIHETPVATVLARANKDSMNLYAEAMCKRLGADVSRASGSWENGTAAMGAFVKSCGVTESEFNFDDGCGLSRKNGVSANAIARVLARSFSSKDHDIFLASLSVAGFDGTLDNRFKDSDLRGRVHAKSGFISGVSALSGYVKTKDGSWYAFSILMNGVGDVATCKQLQERIVKAIDNASAVSKIASGQ